MAAALNLVLLLLSVALGPAAAAWPGLSLGTLSGHSLAPDRARVAVRSTRSSSPPPSAASPSPLCFRALERDLLAARAGRPHSLSAVDALLADACSCHRGSGGGEAAFALPLVTWSALRLRAFETWARGRNFAFPLARIEKPITLELQQLRLEGGGGDSRGGELDAARTGMLLTPVSFVLSRYAALVDAGAACGLLHVDRHAMGAAAWTVDHGLVGMFVHAASQPAVTPLWAEVARRALRLQQQNEDAAASPTAARARSYHSQPVFSAAQLDAAVRSVSAGIATAAEVRNRTLVHTLPEEVDASVRSALAAGGGEAAGHAVVASASNLQWETYQFPASKPHKSHRYRAINASQMIIAAASVFHFENITAAGRFTVLARVPHGTLHARRRQRLRRRQLQAAGRPADGTTYLRIQPEAGEHEEAAFGLPAWLASEALHAALRVHHEPVLAVSSNRYSGNFYHTLLEQGQATHPLHALLAGAPGLARKIVAYERFVHRFFTLVGLRGVPFEAQRQGAVQYAHLLLQADPVPPNWPDPVAMLSLREAIRDTLGVGADTLAYLRGHASDGGGGGGGSEGPLVSSDGGGGDPGEAGGGGAPLLGADAASVVQMERQWEVAAAAVAAAAGPSRASYPFTHPCHHAARHHGHRRRRRVLLLRRRTTRMLDNFDALLAAAADTGASVAVFDDAAPPPHDDALRLFAAADVVVGPHGAGFTNLLACRAGTAVLEVLSDSWRLHDFAHVSMVLGLRYRRWSLRGGGGQNAPLLALTLAQVEDMTWALCQELAAPGGGE